MEMFIFPINLFIRKTIIISVQVMGAWGACCKIDGVPCVHFTPANHRNVSLK